MDDVTGRDVKDDRRRSAADSAQSMRAFMADAGSGRAGGFDQRAGKRGVRDRGLFGGGGCGTGAAFRTASAITECRSSATCSIRCRGSQWGFGRRKRSLQSAIIAAIEAPLAHRRADVGALSGGNHRRSGAVDELPIPRFFEHERGPYITAGAIVAKDRRTGQTNLSIARLMPLGGNRAFVGIAPNHHLAVLARQAHARGETLDIAVCIGNHPAVLIASCLYLGLATTN